ncbi:MAG: nuclear transport factor 2 family protein [Gloeobacteraceae cyanobacterium ES-bin-316]|nr:nuclear transport factor 2 family protein [Ferruginibacter sp.]
MNTPELIISNFYSAFQKLDAASMNDCYDDEVVFSDPVFELLRAEEVKAMWRMLCKNAKDFSLTFGNIQDLGDDYYTCDWKAAYTFSKTGRKVVNNVKANMKLQGGKITEHSDAFSLHKWSEQALGTSGWLLGWNSFFQRKIKNSAKKSLLRFMQAE